MSSHTKSALKVDSVDEFTTALSASPLVVVEFSAAWCKACRRTRPVFLKLCRAYRSTMFMEVDVDGSAELAQHCGVHHVPTYMTFKYGKMAGQVTGPREKHLELIVQQLHLAI